MTEFTKQYAVRLPNGQLHAHKAGGYAVHNGVFIYMTDEDAEPEPVVYDTIEEAEESIKRFQQQAAHMGIIEWMGHIETRYCTPFTSTEPSAEMLSDLESWLHGNKSDE